MSGKAIAKQAGASSATVSRVTRRARLSRMRDLDAAEPIRRYDRAHPGELIHIDIKKLGRIDGVGHRITGDRTRQSNRRGRGEGLGWEFAHVCIDDASRLAFVEMKPNEKAICLIAFLRAAIASYERIGVTVTRVTTDNGSCYKASAFRDACRVLGLKHIRTKPFMPKTNGRSQNTRTALLAPTLQLASTTRGIHANPPISKLVLDQNKMMRLHILGSRLITSS